MADEHDADKHLNLPLGISLTIGEIGLMIVISALVKLVGADIHTLTILMFRYAGCLPLLVVTALWQRGRHALQISRYRTLAIRTAAGLTSLGCFYAALDLMPLSKAMVLFQTLTLFVTLLAPLILGERVGWRRWTAVAVGFLGTMIVLKPDAQGWTAAGIMFGLGSPLFGAIMLIALRRLGQHDSALSTSVWYNSIGTVTFAGLVAVQGLAIRTAAGLTSLGCFYAALDLMPLSKAMVLFQTLTLFVTLLAPLILGERVGWRRWTAVAVGFLGTMIVLKPDAQGWTAAGIMFGLGSPLFGAIMLIALRRLGQHDSALSTSVWYNSIGTVTFAGLVAVQGLALPTAPSDLMILAALGILSSFQQFFMAFSHRVAPATALAPFRYLAIPMGIVAGILFFGEVLTFEIVIGSAIIIASSIFILRRERQLRAAGAGR